jgi:ABC-type transport system involved in multi-copper enzyme maturation permease subunit
MMPAMFSELTCQVRLTLLWAFRDRVMHAVLGVGLGLLLLVPVFSSFSMRQVQESAIALSLSASSLTLLVVATLLGASSVFRDVDRHYTKSVLGLPLTRGKYLLGKFIGLVLFLLSAQVILSICSALVIVYAASTYPSQLPIPWLTLSFAFAADGVKAIVVAAVALLFSTVSTSFTMPFFCTLAIWLAGSVSQEAYEYISGSLGVNLPQVTRIAAEIVYYLLPNFTCFDFHIQAIYALPFDSVQFGSSLLYGGCYVAVLTWLAVLIFNRREFP